MLILTRQNGESLKLVTQNDEVVEIIVTNVRGEQVKIGFEAPLSHQILRQELIERMVVA